MGSENYITIIRDLPMKGSGMVINFMAKARFIMIVGKRYSLEASITRIFKITKPFGQNMMVKNALI